MNEIGEILKEARIEKGYTLDDLQQITKIQKRYLQAIEDGNTEILPGRFYARAFVKQYADIVGLDGEQLLEEHLDESSKEASEEFAEKVNVAPTRSTHVKRGGGSSDWQENLPTILIFLLVAAIFIVIYVAWRQADAPSQDENSIINEESTEQVGAPVTEETNEAIAEPAEDTTEETEETEEEDEEEPEEQEVTVAESSGAETTYEVTGPHPEEQTLVLSASGGDSWVSVSVDGGSEQAQLLTDGAELSVDLSADVSQVDIIVGNAPVTKLALNENELPAAPEAADNVRQDVHLQFTEE